MPNPVLSIQTLYLGFLEQLPQKARCLDIGFGSGFLLETLHLYQNQTDGLEASRELVDWFLNHSSYLVEHRVFGDELKDTPAKNYNSEKEYQFIFCLDVLELVKNKDAFILALNKLKTSSNTIVLSLPYYHNRGHLPTESELQKLLALGQTEIIRIKFPCWFSFLQTIRAKLRQIARQKEADLYHENINWLLLRRPIPKLFLFTLYNLILELLAYQGLQGEITQKITPNQTYLLLIN